MKQQTTLAKQSLMQCKRAVETQLKQTFTTNPKQLKAWGLTAHDTELAQIWSQTINAEGKRIRAWLLKEWCEAHGGSDAAIEAAALIEAIHAATLIIDDVQDNSALRRGEPTVSAVHGDAVAISAGLSLLYGATHAAKTLPNGAAVQQLVVSYVTELAHGQAKDVIWHRNANISVTQNAYEHMCAEKTAKLFILAVRVAETIAGDSIQTKALDTIRARAPVVDRYFPDARKATEEILNTIGIIYQLADDIANITTELGKERAEDVRERKVTALTLAVMHYGTTKEKRTLQNFYRKRTVHDAEIADIVSLYASSGALARVQERIELLENKTRSLINTARLDEKRTELLRTLLALSLRR